MSRTFPRPTMGPGSGFPTSLRTMHRYASYNLIMSPGVTLAANYVFCANGLYDPDISGIGHQPLGFDQFTPIYDHYQVVKCRIIVDLVNDGDQPGHALCGIRASDSSTVVTDVQQLQEMGDGVTGIIGGNWPQTTNTNFQQHTKRLSMEVDIAKFLALKDIADNQNTKGLGIANPGEKVFFHVWASHPYATGANTVTIAAAYLEFDTIWSEPKELARS